MEEEKAHNLYQHFSDVHAAARSGRVIIPSRIKSIHTFMPVDIAGVHIDGVIQ